MLLYEHNVNVVAMAARKLKEHKADANDDIMCMYMDELNRLETSTVDCHIGQQFMGAFHFWYSYVGKACNRVEIDKAIGKFYYLSLALVTQMSFVT